MKKFLVILLVMVLTMLLTASFAMSEAVDAVPVDEPVDQAGYTWAQLATIFGATAATLLIVQYIKLPIDKVWRIPTRVIVYVIGFLIMLLAQVFTVGISLSAMPLLLLNAVLVATSAMGTYELTFSNNDQQKRINAP
jgi:hypothetical protein